MRSDRRDFLRGGALTILGSTATGATSFHGGTATAVPEFEFEEATISDLQVGMQSGKLTARAVAQAYLDRIESVDHKGPALRSVIETNPDALSIADALDKERRIKGPRGPLHGIPILLKDNIDTADRNTTTAGSLALAGSIALRDAFLVQNLRAAGVVLLGKANLSEWSRSRSVNQSSGWSARGGQCKNPYALDRSPGGSSSGCGAAVAANLCAAAVGTETDGSIVNPSNVNGIVGLKPTLGLVSRSGVIPFARSQDTAGPMCRTVRDAAILLSAMTGVDPRDSATAASHGHLQPDYTRFLDPSGLKGARIGVHRKAFGFHEEVDRLMEEAILEMKRQGATVVDPADIAHTDDYGDGELIVLYFELKEELNAYLANLAPKVPIKTLADVIAFNEAHKDVEMPYFGQDRFLSAERREPIVSRGVLTRPLTPETYLNALADNRRLAGLEGIDAIMSQHRLDSIIVPTDIPAWMIDLVNGDAQNVIRGFRPSALAGYPVINVPLGFVRSLPVGISFLGRAWSEPTLLRVAYAFEQATKQRRAPRFLPTAGSN